MNGGLKVKSQKGWIPFSSKKIPVASATEIQAGTNNHKFISPYALAQAGLDLSSGAVAINAGDAVAEGGGAGAISIQSGDGFAGAAAVNGTNAGAITIVSGAAGTAVTGTGGNGGTIAIQGAAGGATSGAAGTGGNGSSVNISAGDGGADTEGGSGTGGDGGSIVLTPGAAGAGATPGTVGTIAMRLNMQIGTLATDKIGFFGQTPVVQLPKASYNNWAAFGDVVNALVAIGLFDAA